MPACYFKFVVNETRKSPLEELDWDKYGCQCPVHNCENKASFSVKIHALHDCDKPWLADGNRVEFRCVDCLKGLITHVAKSLRRVRRYLPSCETCGAPLAEIADVVREVRNLG